jgi:hypothetical protein
MEHTDAFHGWQSTQEQKNGAMATTRDVFFPCASGDGSDSFHAILEDGFAAQRRTLRFYTDPLDAIAANGDGGEEKAVLLCRAVLASASADGGSGGGSGAVVGDGDDGVVTVHARDAACVLPSFLIKYQAL